MEKTHMVFEAQLIVKELELLREYERHQRRPLVFNPFWRVRILLAQDLQSKAQMAHGIRESLTLIQRGQQESVVGFYLLDQITTEVMDHLGEPAMKVHPSSPCDPPL